MSVAVVAGAGGVLGRALVDRFAAAGYAVGTLRRGSASPGAAAGESCDLGDAAAVEAAAARLVAALGDADVLVCNAAQLIVAPFQELAAADFEAPWRVAVAGAAASVRAVLPAMRRRGRGTVIFSGATASKRGAARFAAFSSAKFALRGLAQALAREVQPEGVHVVHVVLDGLLRGSPSAARFGAAGANLLDPAAAAAAYLGLVDQPDSAWSHEIDLRPAGERF